MEMKWQLWIEIVPNKNELSFKVCCKEESKKPVRPLMKYMEIKILKTGNLEEVSCKNHLMSFVFQPHALNKNIQKSVWN